MSTVTEAQARLKEVDLVIMMLVEKLRHQGEPAHATAVASHIKGAPIAEIQKKLEFMVEVGVLDKVVWRAGAGERMPYSVAVSSLGAEILMLDVEGFSPSTLEQYRRDRLDASAQAGRMRS